MNAEITPAQGRRRVRLQAKLVVTLLLLSLVPLAVSALFVGDIGEVAQNFARNHVAELRPHLEKSQNVYRDLISSTKQRYEELARRLASTTAVREIAMRAPGVEGEDAMAKLLDADERLVRVQIVDKRGEVLGAASRPASELSDDTRYHELRVRQATGVAGAEFVAIFAADLAPVRDLQALGEALNVSRRVDTVQSSLPSSYRIAFLLLVGGVVVVVTAIAIMFAGAMSRRIDALVSGTRRVARGDLQARVDLGGKDELAELAAAFNGMVSDLQDERQKILYLQRIGAWQDVARKLAHEIKNPLTPILLVVQQIVSSYEGSDERYEQLLRTCDEIVHEEIDGLKRLVDAFRDLGRLPQVEAAELPVASILDDLRSDPSLADHLEVTETEPDLVVRADRLLLRRSLVNLLENGVHAGQDEGAAGRVVLRCRRSGEFAEFVVDDEGAGVPEAKRELIFDPYVTSKETGTGLGLAIAKKIALDHRGDLSLDDGPAPTGGARFVLEIPLA